MSLSSGLPSLQGRASLPLCTWPTRIYNMNINHVLEESLSTMPHQHAQCLSISFIWMQGCMHLRLACFVTSGAIAKRRTTPEFKCQILSCKSQVSYICCIAVCDLLQAFVASRCAPPLQMLQPCVFVGVLQDPHARSAIYSTVTTAATMHKPRKLHMK